jgi:drug/metabolite transporter (DMT)-like permease
MVSIPFHQIMRSTSPVFTVLIYRLRYHRAHTTKTYLSLIPIVLGVGLATYGDYYFTIPGFVLTLLGVILASIKVRLHLSFLSKTGSELMIGDKDGSDEQTNDRPALPLASRILVPHVTASILAIAPLLLPNRRTVFVLTHSNRSVEIRFSFSALCAQKYRNPCSKWHPRFPAQPFLVFNE